MVKLAVWNKKELLKYLVKITIILLCIVGVTRYFFDKNNKRLFEQSDNQSKSQEVEKNYKKIEKNGKTDLLLSILDKTIPSIKDVNEDDYMENENSKGLEPLKMILNSQLGMLGTLEEKKQNEKEMQENNIANEEQIEEEQVQHAETNLQTEVLENNVPTSYTNEYNGVFIKNGTDYGLTTEMLTPDITLDNKNIILFHTHTCESYTPTEKYNYTQSGNFRTIDLNFSVARVGTELEKQLKSYNYNVIHDMTYHDYPAYNGSYDRSMQTVENILKSTSADIIIDLHRDAIADSTYAPTVKIGEEYASQLMFVIGTDGGGLEHENWVQNLKFAVKIQEKANELYPGLFKPIVLRNSRYNQQLGKAACIIEVGATGNTLEQSMTSMKYLAKVINEVVK